MSKLTQMIIDLNYAYTKLNEGLKVLAKYRNLNPKINQHFYKIGKGFHYLNQEIYKELQKKNLDEQFKEITDKFDEK